MYRPDTLRHIHTMLLCAAVTLGMVSCQDDRFGSDEPSTPTDRICFGTVVPTTWPDSRSYAGEPVEDEYVGTFVLRSDSAGDTLCVNMTVGAFNDDPVQSSRGALVTTATIHSTLGVSGYVANATDNRWGTYFDNEQNDRPASGTGVWNYTSGRTYFWPGEGFKMRFSAYSPFTASGLTYSGGAEGAYPTLSYRVPTNINSQTDLLAAKTGEMAGDYYNTVSLDFKHICTAVQFVEGPDMQHGTIESITFKGIPYIGKYSYDTDSWTLESGTADFTQTLKKKAVQTPGAAITDDGACFVMLPQTLPAGATLEIVFHDDITNSDRTLSADISGQTWPQGRRVKYSLSITPDYKFELTDVPETLDAHYILHKTTLKVTGVPAGKTWTIEAPTFDEDVTIQNQSEMNSFAQIGFWTDRIIGADGSYKGCARGSRIYKGSGSVEIPIALFIPENVGAEARDIELTVKFDGVDLTAQTIKLKQLAPAWVDGSNYGWEQIDDNQTGEFGFCWDRQSMYLVPYDRLSRPSGPLYPLPDTYQEVAKQLLNRLIAQYNASSYVKYVHKNYNDGTTLGRRTYVITLNYSQLNLVGQTFSRTDGYANTSAMMTVGKGAISMIFENVLSSITKKSAGENKVDALFRQPEIKEGKNEVAWNTDFVDAFGNVGMFRTKGDIAPGSGVMNHVLKKNAFDLLATVNGDASDYILDIKEIKWYLPAVEQFNNLPSVQDAIVSDECWSSNPNLNNRAEAYLGDDRSVSRLEKHKVRVCRNR